MFRFAISPFTAFSIGQSQVADARSYFAKQKDHHARQSFQDELLAFLEKYGVEYDPRYIWT